MMGVTPLAFKLLAVIDASFKQRGFAPTYDEMGSALEGKSKSGIARLLGQLEARGYIRRLKNHKRAIELLNHTRTICPNCNHEFEPASHHLRRGETLDGSPVPRHAIEGEFQKGAA